jgi:adenylosuccinate synthase
MKRNVYAIIDGQAGSCGKGKAIGQFAIEKKVDVAIANCMPNAGHTFSMNGESRVFRNIPVSSVNKNTTLFLGAGSVIDMDVLEEEYERNKDILEGREIIVHPRVPIIQSKHIEEEKRRIRSGSTFKGGGACLAEKIMRSDETKFFKEFKSITADENYHEKLKHYLDHSKRVLIEGSQGCDLDINHSGHWPYVTSRQINVAQMLADSGVSPMRLKETIMVIRPFPIRISNTTNIGQTIYSGNYGTSRELTWSHINVGAALGLYPTTLEEFGYDIVALEEERRREEAYFKEEVGDDTARCDGYYSEILQMYITNYAEYTTVTKKERRIFDLDINQLKKNIYINTPTSLYLNFFQQLNSEYEGLKGKYDDIYIDKYQREYLYWLEEETGVPVTMLGTGPDLDEYIIRKQYTRKLRK